MVITCFSLRLKWLFVVSVFFLLLMFNVHTLSAATATLTWNPPAVNEDGSDMTDLHGYMIYIGTSPDEYTQYIDVGNVTTYDVSELSYETSYYFAVTAYDKAGNESNFSNQASITLPSAIATYNPEITITDSITPKDDLLMPFGDITEFNSIDQTVLIKNVGNANLVIGSIIQDNSLSDPFSIFNDSCSFQSIVPADSCAVTIRFAPTATGIYTDRINIPSNDPSKANVLIALNGNGLSSDTNNPPSEPELVSPRNKGKGQGRKVGFKWKKSSDPDGDTVTYELNVCQDPEMTTGCETQTTVASVQTQNIQYAGIGSSASGFLFFVIGLILKFSKKSRQFIRLFVVTISITGMVFLSSCGKVGSTGAYDQTAQPDEVELSSEDINHVISDLNTGSIYYWQVIATDDKGGKSYSPVWSFETAQE